jgi:hypothetical protein
LLPHKCRQHAPLFVGRDVVELDQRIANLGRVLGTQLRKDRVRRLVVER